VLNRLAVGIQPGGRLAGQGVVAHGPRPVAPLGEVIGQPRRFVGQTVGVESLERLAHTAVVAAALAQQDRLVGGVARQGVAEGVFGLDPAERRPHQIGLGQPLQVVAQPFRRPIRQPFQHPQREGAANDRRQLQCAAYRRVQLVNARRQQRLDIAGQADEIG